MTDLIDQPAVEAPLPPEYEIVLRFIGDGSRFIPGVPTRDLTVFDLGRIVYRRSVGDREDRSGGHVAGDPEFAEALETVVASLVDGGLYEPASAPAPSKKKAAAAPDPVPAQTAPAAQE